ncbi:hypothetical protein K502DRAFT_243462 [Neoconidiobolus thromboides FSU 785]|nr:hypothetical protein K502DRAFT_243462 [Neoconidiobolus thromboides FSU 785]
MSQSRAHLHCLIYEKIMTLDKFAKNQHQFNDKARCLTCVKQRNEGYNCFVSDSDHDYSSSLKMMDDTSNVKSSELKLNNENHDCIVLDEKGLSSFVVEGRIQTVNYREDVVEFLGSDLSTKDNKHELGLKSNLNYSERDTRSMNESIDESRNSTKTKSHKSIFDDSSNEEEGDKNQIEQGNGNQSVAYYNRNNYNYDNNSHYSSNSYSYNGNPRSYNTNPTFNKRYTQIQSET